MTLTEKEINDIIISQNKQDIEKEWNLIKWIFESILIVIFIWIISLLIYYILFW